MVMHTITYAEIRVQGVTCYKEILFLAIAATALRNSYLYYFLPLEDCKNGLHLLIYMDFT